MFERCSGLCLLTAVLALGTTVAGQNADIDQTFPFFSCMAASSDGQLGDVIFTGLGGGVVALKDDGTNVDPHLAGGEDELRSGGVTWGISLTPASVYVASGKRGLTRFPRPALNDRFELTGLGNARAVDATTIAAGEIILVGTNDDDGDGSLHLATRSPLDDVPTLRDSDPIGAPVFALDSYLHDGMLTVLVGTACASVCCPTEAASVWRYDINVSGGLPVALPAPSDHWSALVGGSPVPTFVRDIVIDPQAAVAYVAAHERGVFRLELGTGLLVQTTSGWPVTEGGAGPNRHVCLALHKPTSGEVLLALGLGENYPDDRQEYGLCEEVEACTGANRTPSAMKGIRLLDVSTATPVSVGFINVRGNDCQTEPPPVDCPFRLTRSPIKLSARADGANAFRLDAASVSHGLQVVRVTRDGSTWSLAKEGSFDEGDGFPVSSCDDIVRIGPDLIASFERGVVAFDVSAADSSPSDPDVLETYSVPAFLSGAILLAPLPKAGSYPGMVFGSAHDQGVAFFELRDPNGDGKTDWIQNLGSQPTNGRCYSQTIALQSQTPSGKPWLLAVNNRDDETLFGGLYNSGLRLYELTATGGHVDPGMPSDTQLIGSYAPRATIQPTCGEGEMGSFFDAVIGATPGSNEFSVWMTYGPREGLNEKRVGLITLKGTYFTFGPRVAFEFVGKTPLATACDVTDSNVGRLTLGTDGRLYAAFGCHGIAAFVPQSPGTAATLADVWDGTSSALIALQARLDLNNRVYVTFLNDRIAAFNASNLAAGPLTNGWAETEFQPNAIWPAPSAEAGKSAFWVADGTAGLHRLQYHVVP